MGGVALDAARQRQLGRSRRSWRPQPQRHASTKDPSTWSDYADCAGRRAGRARRRHHLHPDRAGSVRRHRYRQLPRTSAPISIDIWAQNFLDVGRHSYSEVTPSGTGCRIWGLADRRAAQPKIHARDRRQADRGRAVPAHQQGADRHRLHARSCDQAAHQYRQGDRLGGGVGRAAQGGCRGSGRSRLLATASTATAAATRSSRSRR